MTKTHRIKIAAAFSAAGRYSMLWLLTALLGVVFSSDRRGFVVFILAIIAEWALTNAPIKMLFERKRPDNSSVVDLTPSWLKPPRSSSFPSGHSSAAAFATVDLVRVEPNRRLRRTRRGTYYGTKPDRDPCPPQDRRRSGACMGRCIRLPRSSRRKRRVPAIVEVFTTVPTKDPRDSATLFADLEAIGYDGAFSFESNHDPFLPLSLASTSTTQLQLGTAIAIGFARNPMVLANIGHDMQLITEGRFILGLGSQVRPHIERRFSETWSRPAARMRELVLAIRAIWSTWNTGEPLKFEGEFYQHTIMIPAFNPGPNPFGPPPIYTGGFGPRMIEVAGEVADGFITHPFNSEASLQEIVQPALDAGRAKRTDGQQTKVVCVAMITTWSNSAERQTALISLRDQIGFYGSTPAYKPVLDLHGFSDLHAELNAMSKQGRWTEMAALIPDELLEAVAILGPRGTIAAQITDRYEGIADAVSLVNNRNPDPTNFADIVADLKSL